MASVIINGYMMAHAKPAHLIVTLLIGSICMATSQVAWSQPDSVVLRQMIPFTDNSDTIALRWSTRLDSVASYLASHPECMLEMVGKATGAEDDFFNLLTRRLQNTIDSLAARGIAERRVVGVKVVQTDSNEQDSRSVTMLVVTDRKH